MEPNWDLADWVSRLNMWNHFFWAPKKVNDWPKTRGRTGSHPKTLEPPKMSKSIGWWNPTTRTFFRPGAMGFRWYYENFVSWVSGKNGLHILNHLKTAAKSLEVAPQANPCPLHGLAFKMWKCGRDEGVCHLAFQMCTYICMYIACKMYIYFFPMYEYEYVHA